MFVECPVDGNCPVGWTLLEDDPDSCRRAFMDIPMTWVHANAFCIGLGGQLATFKTDNADPTTSSRNLVSCLLAIPLLIKLRFQFLLLFSA